MAVAATAVLALPKHVAVARGMWVLLLIVAIVAMLVSRASAQQGNFPYQSIPMHPKLTDEAIVKQVESATKSYASTGSGDPRIPAGYFSAYVPAKMTAPDGLKYISDIVKETNSLLSRAQRSTKPQVGQQMTKFIYDGMKVVAEGDYHPAARINAILILGRLDGQPADVSTRTPPKPLLQTLPIMIALYENESNVDGVRAAALQGLHRHVSYGFPQITPADRAKISAMMTSLLESSAPSGRSANAHAYLQRFAVDILDTLRAKDDKALGTKLISISTAPTSPDLIALYSASRLATMGPELQGQVTAPKAVLDSWSRRVLAAFEGELARFDAMKKPEADRSQPVKPESLLEKKTTETTATAQARMGSMDDSSMDMGYSMDAMMPDMEDRMSDAIDMDSMMMMPGSRVVEKPQPPEIIATRQRLNSVLQQVHLGVTGQPTAGLPRTSGGILASVAPEQKKIIEDWVAEMETVVTTLNDKTLDDEKKFLESLVAQVEVLREIAGVEDEAPADAGLPDDLTPVDPSAEVAPVEPAAPAANNVLDDLVSP